jgi:methyl-accepting chemotaxis protein
MTTEERLSRLEELFADTADLVLAHNEALMRLEATTQRNSDNIAQLAEQTAEAIAQLTAQVDRLTASAEARDQRIEENNARIREIFEYLYQERPNGR